MDYHFWDMDHTVIDNDCDVSWKEFLISTGRAGPEQQEIVDKFFQQYLDGTLDDKAFMEFQLQEMRGKSLDELRVLTQEHFDTVVKPKIYPRAEAMIREQIAAGHLVCLLTATNREIALPLADYFGFRDIIATELEMLDGVFTGRTTGIYCCAEGKLTKLKAYCATNGIDLADAHYYGDSTSDLPVLHAVGHPHAANPREKVRTLACQNDWDIIDF